MRVTIEGVTYCHLADYFFGYEGNMCAHMEPVYYPFYYYPVWYYPCYCYYW